MTQALISCHALPRPARNTLPPTYSGKASADVVSGTRTRAASPEQPGAVHRIVGRLDVQVLGRQGTALPSLYSTQSRGHAILGCVTSRRPTLAPAVVAIFVLAFFAAETHAMTVGHMTVNGRTNPLGIGAEDISFAWTIEVKERGVVQSAYQIRVGKEEGGNDVWDSGRVSSDRQVDVALPGDVRLSSATRYHWQVRIWDNNGGGGRWSAPAWFETGLRSADDWEGARWISHRLRTMELTNTPDFSVEVEFALHNEAFGVLLWMTPDAQHGIMYQIDLALGIPALRVYEKENGNYRAIAYVDLLKFGFNTNSLLQGWHTLMIRSRGPRIQASLDGQEFDVRWDRSMRSGLLGFRTQGGGSASVRRFAGGHDNWAIESDFEHGQSGLSGGAVSNGIYHIAGDVEALFTGAPRRLPLLRGEFYARGRARNARIYASARGLYQLSINGQKVGDQFLAPGWTDYSKRIQSQTYDVTPLLRQGNNVIEAALGDGWYRGNVGLRWSQVYGDTLAFLAKLRVAYSDGFAESFVTDKNWHSAEGPHLEADLQDGERYDARLEPRDQNLPSIGMTSRMPIPAWSSVDVLPDDLSPLVPQPDEPVRATEVLISRSRTEPRPGEFIYDLRQNMVGFARVRMRGRKGQTVRIRYAEELYRLGDQRGRIYTDNFRKARATDLYTFARDGSVVYQPTFTQHGFRYVEITGLDAAPATNEVRGVVLGSDLPGIGDLTTSNPMLNQLVKNIRWGARGNLLSIPTDTPARDERLGWTGDINVFAPTACRYMDARAFLSKWMDDMRDAQKADGNIPAVVPQPRLAFDETGVGWSDAFITVPHAVWRATGDTRIVRRNWDAMRRFYDFVYNSATKDGNLLEEGRSSWFSGDWLSLEGGNYKRLEEHKVIATAYFAEDTRMMAEMAAALGETDLAGERAALVPRIREAFVAAYRQPDGSIYTGTQTAYALALGMDMIADVEQRELTAGKFVEKLASDDCHLKTGFLGTPWLLPALSKCGRDDLAMRLLLNEDYPSWGFEIRMGATTMWERWNSIRANGEFGPVDMNSFNHYAYGAVGDWMFGNLAGIQIVEPGYKKSRIAPLIGAGGVSHAKGSIWTSYGLLASEWTLNNGRLLFAVTVPANSTAEVVIPADRPEVVKEGKATATSAPGVQGFEFKDGRLTLVLGSGNYQFTAPEARSVGDQSQ